ncbi:MAG: ATP-binding cassette domain-containing protein, partial [Pseudomonadota bacterium]
QTYALYPHMTVEQNMGFGLKMNGVPKAQIDQKVARAADILKLGDYLNRKPAALSGGQRQRVAIGRAIVRGPEVFLFDEPLSNLDAELRVDMRVEIARLHDEIGATMIYVTHDQVEAMTLADKIVVLRAGYIEQVGAPMDLYTDPDNRFVAGFIGSPSMNFMAGEVIGSEVRIPALDGARVAAPAGATEGPITVGIRPQHLAIAPADASPLAVDLTELLGGVAYAYLATPTGERIIAEQKGTAKMVDDTPVTVTFDPGEVYFFDPDTEARIRSAP